MESIPLAPAYPAATGSTLKTVLLNHEDAFMLNVYVPGVSETKIVSEVPVVHYEIKKKKLFI